MLETSLRFGVCNALAWSRILSQGGKIRRLELTECYRAAVRNYINAAKRLQNAAIAEFSAAHRAAEDARAEFERLRGGFWRASHRKDLDAGV
jgi:hypothetical protein